MKPTTELEQLSRRLANRLRDFRTERTPDEVHAGLMLQTDNEAPSAFRNAHAYLRGEIPMERLIEVVSLLLTEPPD